MIHEQPASQVTLVPPLSTPPSPRPAPLLMSRRPHPTSWPQGPGSPHRRNCSHLGRPLCEECRRHAGVREQPGYDQLTTASNLVVTRCFGCQARWLVKPGLSGLACRSRLVMDATLGSTGRWPTPGNHTKQLTGAVQGYSSICVCFLGDLELKLAGRGHPTADTDSG